MATTDLRLDDPGTLIKPGPIGRLVRLAAGIWCIDYAWALIGAGAGGELLTADGHIRPLLWNGALIGLILVSYVVNIGFSRAWKKWPAVAQHPFAGGCCGDKPDHAGYI